MNAIANDEYHNENYTPNDILYNYGVAQQIFE